MNVNSADRAWLEERFEGLHGHLDSVDKRLTKLETKWDMTFKAAAVVGGCISLIISLVVSIFRR